MRGINIVVIGGNLGADAELRYTKNGKPYASFNLAINETFKAQDGEPRERVTWVKTYLFNKAAEALIPYLKKGKGIVVIGRLISQEWDDKETGKARTKLHVVARDVTLVGAPGKDREQAPDWEPDDGDIPF